MGYFCELDGVRHNRVLARGVVLLQFGLKLLLLEGIQEQQLLDVLAGEIYELDFGDAVGYELLEDLGVLEEGDQ